MSWLGLLGAAVLAAEGVVLFSMTRRVARAGTILSVETEELGRHLHRNPAHARALPELLGEGATAFTRELAGALALDPPARASEVNLLLGDVARELSELADVKKASRRLAAFGGAFACVAGFFADQAAGSLFGAWFQALGGLALGLLFYALALGRVARQVGAALALETDRWVAASVPKEEIEPEKDRGSTLKRRRR